MFRRLRRGCMRSSYCGSGSRWRRRIRRTSCWTSRRSCDGCGRSVSPTRIASGSGGSWRCWWEGGVSLLRPFGARFPLCRKPTPYGVGCILSPLRGWWIAHILATVEDPPDNRNSRWADVPWWAWLLIILFPVVLRPWWLAILSFVAFGIFLRLILGPLTRRH